MVHIDKVTKRRMTQFKYTQKMHDGGVQEEMSTRSVSISTLLDRQ